MFVAGTPFTIADVDAEWPLFAARARRTCTAAADLQDHLRRCREGLAVCLTSADALLILALECPPGGRIRAVVLLAVSLGTPNAFKQYEPAMLAIARDLEADELAFGTERRGWRRLLGKEWRRGNDGWFSRGT